MGDSRPAYARRAYSKDLLVCKPTRDVEGQENRAKGCHRGGHPPGREHGCLFANLHGFLPALLLARPAERPLDLTVFERVHIIVHWGNFLDAKLVNNADLKSQEVKRLTKSHSGRIPVQVRMYCLDVKTNSLYSTQSYSVRKTVEGWIITAWSSLTVRYTLP